MSEDEAPGAESPGYREDNSGDSSLSPSIDRAVLGMDHVFESVQHPRRRYLLYALAENPEWTLTELATKLAAWERDIDETEVDAELRERVYISLYHAHVPKLVDLDVIQFDRETETIAAGEEAEAAMKVLEAAGGSLDTAQKQHAEREYDDE
jgi:hypothetical protein